jgi:hypothetical protein
VVIPVAGHAYPWDVLGDPAFADRVLGHGLTEVTLAAAYHSTRAASPLHPRHQVVEAPHAALYRPLNAETWGARRLRPLPPTWMTEADPFGLAVEALRPDGLRVSAWIVLTHNTRLGSEFGEVAVTNCFGDRYSYALCPAHAEVREYAATLAAESVSGVPVDGVSLEACGQLGLSHNSHHEKTDGAWTPAANRLLSVCCCTACRAAWIARGLDPPEVIDSLRAAVHAEGRGLTGELPDTLADELLATRHRSTDLLRAEILDRLRDQASGVPVTLHAHPDPWATGASPGLTAAAPAQVDAILVPAWPTASGTAEDIAAATGRGARVDAYVTVLPPANPDALPAHVTRLITAGARGLSLYHLGLAPSQRQPLLSRIVELAATAEVP